MLKIYIFRDACGCGAKWGIINLSRWSEMVFVIFISVKKEDYIYPYIHKVVCLLYFIAILKMY